MRAPRFARRGDRIEARLDAAEAGLLRHVAESMREVLDDEGPDPARERLFPAAYAGDAERQTEWTSLTHDDLAAGRRAAVETLLGSLDGGRSRRGGWTGTLSEEDAQAWMGVLNDGRLVLGVRLDVTEETTLDSIPSDDPRRGSFEVYAYLGWILSELLEALEPGLHGDLEEG